jgi:hypothetical protein
MSEFKPRATSQERKVTQAQRDAEADAYGKRHKGERDAFEEMQKIKAGEWDSVILKRLTTTSLKEAIAAVIAPDAARYINGQEQHRQSALWAGSEAVRKAEDILAVLSTFIGPPMMSSIEWVSISEMPDALKDGRVLLGWHDIHRTGVTFRAFPDEPVPTGITHVAEINPPALTPATPA